MTSTHWLILALLTTCSLAACSSSSDDVGNGDETGGDDSASPDDGESPGDSSSTRDGGGGSDTSDAVGDATTDGRTTPDAPLDADATTVSGTLRFVGRVDVSDPKAPKLGWSASGVVATVSGTKISVKLTSTTSDVFFAPLIDGKRLASFSVAAGATKTITIADALKDGDHQVELYRETEGQYGYSVFGGFVDGTVVGAPPSNGRLLEVVGDSISAGYGNLGVEIHPPWDNTCGFTLDTESAYQSYASILARALNAEVSIVARSGWGMQRDLGGSTAGVLPSIYDHSAGADLAAKWDFTRKPQAVLINLGTNDSGKGDPGAAFESAYVTFVKSVRGHYPDAWIFVTFGTITDDPMLTTMRGHLDKIVTTLGDKKVVAIAMDVQDATSTGCDYHPNVAEDQKMSDQLAPTIKSKLGW